MSNDWCPENDGAYRMELAAKERDTITALRARLEQAERERGAALGEATGFSVKDYHDGKEAGFRAGIEAAALEADGWFYDPEKDEITDPRLSIQIRALTPTEQCFSVKEGFTAVACDPMGMAVPLSEALSIRPAADVRREAFGEAKLACGWDEKTKTAIDHLIDTPAPSTDTTPTVAEAARVKQAIVELEAVKDYAEQPLYNHLEVGFRHNPLTNAETLERYKYACEVLAVGINAALRALSAQTGGE